MRSNQFRNNYAPSAPHPLSERDLPDLANCCSCYEKIRGRAFIAACQAKHRYCFHCVRRIYTLATTRDEKWPARCCKVPFVSTNPFIAVFLTDYEIGLYSKKSMELSTSVANRVYCSRQGCAAYLGSREDNRGAAFCPYCKAATCWTCKHPTRRDLLSRENITSEAYFLRVDPGWKRCKDCGTIVEKVTSTGCIHMTCGYDHTYCYFSGKMEWSGLSRTCRCRRPDGRLHRQSPYSLPDPSTTFSPRVPEPRPSSRFDVILTEENILIPMPTIQPPPAQLSCTYTPRVESFTDRQYPYRLPSTTAQGPADVDSILRERERWEASPYTYPEYPTEGACCLSSQLLLSLQWKEKSLAAGSGSISNTVPLPSPPPTPCAPSTENPPSTLYPEMRMLMQQGSLDIRKPFGPIGTEIVPAPSPLSVLYKTPVASGQVGPFGPMNTLRTSVPVGSFGPIGTLRRTNGPVSPFGPIGTPRTSGPISPFGQTGAPLHTNGLASPFGPIGALRTSGPVSPFGPLGTPFRTSGQVTPLTLAGTPRASTDTPTAPIDTPTTSIASPLAPIGQVTSSLRALNIQSRNLDNYLTEDSTQFNSFFTEDVSWNNPGTYFPKNNDEHDWWGGSRVSVPGSPEVTTYPLCEPIDVDGWQKELRARDQVFQIKFRPHISSRKHNTTTSEGNGQQS